MILIFSKSSALSSLRNTDHELVHFFPAANETRSQQPNQLVSFSLVFDSNLANEQPTQLNSTQLRRCVLEKRVVGEIRQAGRDAFWPQIRVWLIELLIITILHYVPTEEEDGEENGDCIKTGMGCGLDWFLFLFYKSSFQLIHKTSNFNKLEFWEERERFAWSSWAGYYFVLNKSSTTVG